MDRGRPIKPIRQRHGSLLLRSILEWRWVQFFDALGLRYEYEPDAFPLGEREWYRPDFLISDWDAYVEIKPANGVMLRGARSLCLDLAQATGKTVLLVLGPPVAGQYSVEVYASRKSGRHNSDGGRFAECPRCSGFGVLCDWGWSSLGTHPCDADLIIPPDDAIHSPRLHAAYSAAYKLEPQRGASA